MPPQISVSTTGRGAAAWLDQVQAEATFVQTGPGTGEKATPPWLPR